MRRRSGSRSRSREDMYDWDMYDHENIYDWDTYDHEICMIEICDWDDWNMWLRWLKYVWSWDTCMYDWGMFSHWRQDPPGACAWNVLWQTCRWPCHDPGECLCAQITASGHSSDLPALCSVDRTLHSRGKSCLARLSLSWPAAPAERWGWC